MINKKPFSETLKVLLKFSKEYKESFNIKALQECLGPIYHPTMRLRDILIVLDGTLKEALTIKELELPNKEYIYLKILTSPFEGSNPLGEKIFGPRLEDKFSIEEFYNKIITEYMHTLMLTNIGWCREYVFGEQNVN